MEVSSTLENGYEIREWDTKAKDALHVLQGLELARGTEHRYVKCANPNDPDFEELPDHIRECTGEAAVVAGDHERGFVICPKCRRSIDLVAKEYESSVTVEVISDEISRWLESLVKPHVDSIRSLHRPFSWKVERNNQAAVVFVLDYYPLVAAMELAQSNHGVVTIVWSNRLHSYLASSDTGWNIVSSAQLVEGTTSMFHHINLAFSQPLSKESFWRSFELLSEFVSRPDPQGKRFEAFSRRFIQGLLFAKNAIDALLLSVERIRPMARWTVSLGGPGKTDLLRIDLYEYLATFFKMIGNVECKSYRKSRFTRQDFSNALGHAVRSSTPDQILFLVSTNDVEAWVWETIDRVKITSGNYNYVVIDLELLAFLLDRLDFEYLLRLDYAA